MAVVVLFDGCEQIDKSILEYFDYLDKELDIAPDKLLNIGQTYFLIKVSHIYIISHKH